MSCSVPDAVYDVLGYVHPFMTASHSGMKFSTPLVENHLLVTTNCAAILGGSWWYTKCSLWCPTSIDPMFFSRGDVTFYSMKNVHMMIKPQ